GVRPHEAAAVGEDVEDAGADVLGLGLTLRLGLAFRLGLALGLGLAPTARLTASALLGPWLGDVLALLVYLLGGLGPGGPVTPLRAQDRVDQILAAHPPEALYSELRRDRVKVGQRALFELAACD